MKKWESERNDTWDWEKDKVLKGVYMDKRIVTTENGDSNLYTIDVGGGKKIDVWGKSMLDSFFKNMVTGTTIEITLKGQKKSQKGGRQYYDFEFQYDDSTADIVEVATKTFDIPDNI